MVNHQFQVDEKFITATLQDLVRINSVNPSLSPNGVNETEVGRYVARVLKDLGTRVELREPEPGRVSVLGTLEGTGTGRSLMLNAHLDTVAVEHMPDPFSAEIREGRLYGRGAYDMKGSLAACLGAVKAIHDSNLAPDGSVVVAAVADEEYTSIGTTDIAEYLRVDGAIVTEPSALNLCVAHKGFIWYEIVVRGRAAHGSKPELGVDANVRMGRFLNLLERLDRELRQRRPHPLVGPPSIHAGVIHGGTGISTYSDECKLEVERRTVPGEDSDQVQEEIDSMLNELRSRDSELEITANRLTVREPFETSPDSPLARDVYEAATNVRSQPPAVIGETPWMDSAILAAHGVDTVVMGVDGGGAHAAEEWVELDSVYRLAEILARAAVSYCK